MKEEIQNLKDKDLRIRKEFAKAFKWFESSNAYHEERDPLSPTWEEIFTQLGKLLASRDQIYEISGIKPLKEKIEEMDEVVQILFNKIQKPHEYQ